MAEQPVKKFDSDQDWEQWLDQNAAVSQGVWLKIAKKGAGERTVDYQEALRTALCFGWIDGQRNKFDETYFLQKFTPRRPRSLWSKRNQTLVAELTSQGRMRPAGLAEVERARQDGRWEAAYDSPANATVPADFQAALDENPAARDSFNQLNSTNRYAVLWRIQTAKKPETRQKRMAQLIEMLNEGKKLY